MGLQGVRQAAGRERVAVQADVDAGQQHRLQSEAFRSTQAKCVIKDALRKTKYL